MTTTEARVALEAAKTEERRLRVIRLSIPGISSERYRRVAAKHDAAVAATDAARKAHRATLV